MDKHEAIEQLGNVTDNWSLLREILKSIVGPKVESKTENKKGK